MIGTVANPSRPSVKLTALDEPIITKSPNGIKNKPLPDYDGALLVHNSDALVFRHI